MAIFFRFGEIFGFKKGFCTFFGVCRNMMKMKILLLLDIAGTNRQVPVLQHIIAFDQKRAPGVQAGQPLLLVADLALRLADLGEKMLLQIVQVVLEEHVLDGGEGEPLVQKIPDGLDPAHGVIGVVPVTVFVIDLIGMDQTVLLIEAQRACGNTADLCGLANGE